MAQIPALAPLDQRFADLVSAIRRYCNALGWRSSSIASMDQPASDLIAAFAKALPELAATFNADVPAFVRAKSIVDFAVQGLANPFITDLWEAFFLANAPIKHLRWPTWPGFPRAPIPAGRRRSRAWWPISSGEGNWN